MPDNATVTIYLVDTSVLVNIRDKYGDSEKIWGALGVAIEAGRVKTVRQVFDELESKFPEIYARLKKFKRQMQISDADLYATVAVDEVRQIRRNHPSLYKPLGGGNPADPFLIAAAKAMGAIVATDEKSKGPGYQSKIPYVCLQRNVGWCPGPDFLKDTGCE